MAKILIIDDEEKIRTLLARIIGLEGYGVFQAADAKTAWIILQREAIDVVLCDVKLPDAFGVELASQIKSRYPQLELVLMTAYGNIPDGVQAMRNGAYDYLVKGDDNHKIIPVLANACLKASKNKEEQRQAFVEQSADPFHRIIGESVEITKAITLARKVSNVDLPVLLTGETGTGKEVFAAAIHQASNRNDKSFVAVNCAAIARDLLESVMFGHKIGAFTGALKDQKGLLEEAHKGTLFLDEMGEMPLDLQAKLLRVLENGEFIRVGDTKPTRVDIRIIAATNRNLSQQIQEGTFREDLFYRISVFEIPLPSLRERNKDILLLSEFFARKFAKRMELSPIIFPPEIRELLLNHSWKGNIRELKNVIERLVILSEDGAVHKEHLPVEMYRGADSAPENTSFEMAYMEKIHIQKVLAYTSGNKTEAARLLNIGLTTLYRKIEEYALK